MSEMKTVCAVRWRCAPCAWYGGRHADWCAVRSRSGLAPRTRQPTAGPAAEDNRRPGPRQKTARSLARAQREETIKRLAELRDQVDDLPLALRACELLLRYSDGEPGQQNVPAEPEEAEVEDGDGSIEPPKLGVA
jgi:hypothetical protein